MTSKLSPHFLLTSISSQSDLRGITKHPESGCLLVTFNRNMVSKYKVSEQRPIGSWTSREGFYAPVVYDKENSQYAALLSKNELRLWKEEHTKLSKLKKYVFTSNIWRLITAPDHRVFIVYETGTVQLLSKAIESRKEIKESVIGDNETILDCSVALIEDVYYFTIVTFNERQQSLSVYLLIEKDDAIEMEGNFDLSPRIDCELSGLTIRSANGELALIILWSNGDLYSMPLLKGGGGDEPWGFNIGKIEGIRTDRKASLVALSSRHLAIYGADSNDEGASLLLYNSQFRLVQAKQRLKLYNSPPLMWGPFENQLAIASGNHILITRYHLGVETVASMMGSAKRKATDGGSQVQKISWIKLGEVSDEKPIVFSTAPDSIKESLINMKQHGLPESEMMLKLSSGLMERRDVLGISWCLQNLREVPESVLAKLASFCLRQQDATFTALAPAWPQPPVADETSACLPPESPLVGGRKVLLDTTLNVPFNESRLLPELKHHLSPQDAILLLQHISARLWNGDEPSENTESQVTQLLAWSSTLLDANYQHCLLSMDSQVVHTITALSDIVDTQIGHVEELRALQPFLLRMQQGRRLPKPKDEDRIYSIETVHLL